MDVQCRVRDAEPTRAPPQTHSPQCSAWPGPRLHPVAERSAPRRSRASASTRAPVAERAAAAPPHVAPLPAPAQRAAAASVALEPSPAAAAELRRLQAELQRSERAQSETSAAVLELRSQFVALSRSVAQVSRAQSSGGAPSSVERRSARDGEAAAQRRRAQRAERALRRVVRAMSTLTTGSHFDGGGAMRALCDQLEGGEGEGATSDAASDACDACDASTLLDAIGACAEREADAARGRAIAQAASSPRPHAGVGRRSPALRSPPGGLFARSPVKVVAVDERTRAVDPARVRPLRQRCSPPAPPHLAAAEQRQRRPQRTAPPACLVVAAAAAQSARSASLPPAAAAEAPRRVSPAPAPAPAPAPSPLREAAAVERIERVVDARDIASSRGAPLRQYLVHWERSSSTEDEWFDRASLMVTPEHAALVAAFERGARAC